MRGPDARGLTTSSAQLAEHPRWGTGAPASRRTGPAAGAGAPALNAGYGAHPSRRAPPHVTHVRRHEHVLDARTYESVASRCLPTRG